MTDYSGIALVITASGTFLTAAATAWVALTVRKTHDLVNGLSHEKTVADQRIAFQEGKEAERAKPMLEGIVVAAPTTPAEPTEVKVVNLPSDPVPVDPKHK